MIITVNDENGHILKEKCDKICKYDEALKQLIDHLLTELNEAPSKSVGLAAPQIGVKKQVAIVKPYKSIRTLILINPEIVEHKRPSMVMEGCLSIPGESFITKRYNRIKVATDTLEGKRISYILKGDIAVIAQHEIDHLNGVLISDRE